MDRLTGLPGRDECLHQLEAEVVRCCARQTPLTVLWIGIDRFQQINESFGFTVGDGVLKALARRWCEQLAVGNWARVGGDEFVLVLPGYTVQDAEDVATEVLRVLSLPIEQGELRLRPAGSIGIAQLHPEQSAEALLESADRAMQEAKHAGRNRWVVEGELQRRGRSGQLLAREELAIEELIHEALENGGLVLHYQPLVQPGSGRLEAVEALLRCTVNGTRLPPAQLVPVAEKTGQIVRLGEWTLLQATEFAARLQREGRPLKVAVNISRLQVTSPRFPRVLQAALACTGARATSIELELTESLFMDASPTVRNNLRQAHEAGFTLAIDDFGTGYSCLAYLKDLPASKMKLDRAFAQGLPQDQKSFAVVRTIAQLGRDLGMTVVAEGVETQAQLDSVRAAGVEVIQGHYFSPALPPEQLTRWATERNYL